MNEKTSDFLKEMINKLSSSNEKIDYDKRRADGAAEWMKILGYSDGFATPTHPQEWLAEMIKGFDKSDIPMVYTLIFGYANYLVQVTSKILAEKDAEITFRNDFIYRRGLIDEFFLKHDKIFMEDAACQETEDSSPSSTEDQTESASTSSQKESKG